MAKTSKRLQVDIAPDKIRRIDGIRRVLKAQARRVPSRPEVIDRALEFALSQPSWQLASYPDAQILKG